MNKFGVKNPQNSIPIAYNNNNNNKGIEERWRKKKGQTLPTPQYPFFSFFFFLFLLIPIPFLSLSFQPLTQTKFISSFILCVFFFVFSFFNYTIKFCQCLMIRGLHSLSTAHQFPLPVSFSQLHHFPFFVVLNLLKVLRYVN